MPVDLSVVVVNYKTDELTKNCVDSVKKYTEDIKFEVIVIDNSENNIGFAAGNNAGVKKSKGRYVLLLNSDTLIHDNVLGEMVAWMDENSKIGISSCALKNIDGSLQATGGYFPTLLRVFSWMTIQDLPFVDNFIKPFHPKTVFYTTERELDWVTGAFMLIKREVLNEIVGLDEGYFMYTEDTDICFRAKEKGWKIVYNPAWSITHFGGKSSATREYPILSEFRGIKIFYQKHYSKWQYPVLRFLLKLGSLWRIVLVNPKIYVKAFKEA